MSSLSLQFPQCKYHPDGRIATVANEQKLADLGEGWYDSPADLPYVEPAPVELICAPNCPQCVALFDALHAQEAKFNAAWEEQMQSRALMVKEISDLRNAVAVVEPVEPVLRKAEKAAAKSAEKAAAKLAA